MANEFKIKNGIVIDGGQPINNIVTDTTLSGSSDTSLVTENAVKVYTDTTINNLDIDQYATSADFDAHITDTSIHYETSSIDHSVLQNRNTGYQHNDSNIKFGNKEDVSINRVLSYIWNSTTITGESGFGITENGNGTFDIADGSIYMISGTGGEMSYYNVSGSSNISIPDNNTSYIYTYIDGFGNIQINHTTDLGITGSLDNNILYIISRVGTDLNIIYVGDTYNNFMRRYAVYSYYVDGIERYSGCILSINGMHQISLTAGGFYFLNIQLPTPAINTSSGGVFTYVYSDGFGDWTRVTNSTVIDYNHYDDGDGALGTVSASNYSVSWLYVVHNTPSHFVMLYGDSEYLTEQDALDAGEIATRPPEIEYNSTGHAIYKIIYKGDGTYKRIIDLSITPVGSTISTDNHNELTNLQGGDVDEYFHLDATDYMTVGNTQAHIDNSTIHFTESSIDHTNIQNIGTNTHAQIDSHISDNNIHFTVGDIDGLVTSGGNTGQVLTKSTSADYDYGWMSLPGGGDMLKAIYDTNDNGIVDDSEKLGGALPSNYATSANLDSHTSDSTIHFTESSIDHTNIQNIGTNTHAQIDSHISDGSIHYPMTSIAISADQVGFDNTYSYVSGTNLQTVIDEMADWDDILSNAVNQNTVNLNSHTSDSTIHFTESSIDHTAIQNVGSNTHAQIDSHISDGSIHYPMSSITISADSVGFDNTYSYISGTNIQDAIDEMADNDFVYGTLITQNANNLTAHTSDSTIHFTESSIDHTAIQNVGSNTHAQIDSHISDGSIHYPMSSITISADNVGFDNTYSYVSGTDIQTVIDEMADNDITLTTDLLTHVVNNGIHFTKSSIVHSKAITVPAPEATDSFVMWITDGAITITKIVSKTSDGTVNATVAGNTVNASTTTTSHTVTVSSVGSNTPVSYVASSVTTTGSVNITVYYTID